MFKILNIFILLQISLFAFGDKITFVDLNKNYIDNLEYTLSGELECKKSSEYYKMQNINISNYFEKQTTCYPEIYKNIIVINCNNENNNFLFFNKIENCNNLKNKLKP